MKGASATVRMNELTGFTHVVEDVFDEVRESRSAVTPELVDLLLAAVDIIKGMIASRSEGSVYSDDFSSVVSGLEKSIGAVRRVDEPSRPVPPVERSEPAEAPSGFDPGDITEMQDIAEGRADIVLVTGGEARYRAQLARADSRGLRRGGD